MIPRISSVLAVAVTFLTLAGAAQGAPIVSAEFCNGTPFSTQNWVQFGASTSDDNCDIGGGLEILNEGGLPGDQRGWIMWPPQESPVLSYSFEFDNGDTSTGISYAAASCGGCAPDWISTSSSPGDPTELVTVPVPIGSEGIFIYQQCDLAPYCFPTSDPARISNVKMTTTDETPPKIEGAFNNAAAYPGWHLGWTNKTQVPVSFSPQDGGFGVRRTRMDIDGTAMFGHDFGGDCNFSYPLTYLPPCPGYTGFGGIADIASVGDGTHEVTFVAEDALGNSATTGPATFGIDRKAPAPPASSTLEFTESGWPGQRWTSDPDVVMRWPTIPAAPDPEFDSPQYLQDLSIRREGSPAETHVSVDSSHNSSAQTLTSDGEWNLGLSYGDEAGNVSHPAIESVGLDADAPFAPQDLDDVDWISEEALSGPLRIEWSAPDENEELESGVCGYVLNIDDALISDPVFGVDDSTTATSWPLPAGLPEGVNYVHVRAVSCAGVASETVTSEVRIDTEAPDISVGGLATPGAWIGSAQTALITAADEQSGVEKVGYAIDGGAITWLTSDQVSAAMPEGDHILTAHAVDVAGNESSIDINVRTDTQVPAVELQTPAVDDPTRVAATVKDTHSGLVAASIELRRVDAGASSQERQWAPLDAAEPITRGTTASVELVRILDDVKLAAGDYELRVNAVDLAGNSSIASAFAIRSVQLPLRRRAEVSAAIAQVKTVCRTKTGKSCASVKRCKRKLRCRNVQITDRRNAKSTVVQSWSQKSVLIGDALGPDGAPIAGANVTVSSTPLFHNPDPVGAAVTDARGHYELELPAGPSRTLTAQISGSPRQQPAAGNAKVNVRSELSFLPTPRRLRSGNTILLRGRVRHAEWQPVGGVSVSFQWYSPNGWKSFENPTRTDASGRFGVAYPWTRAVRNSTVRVRARIDEPAGWPFAPGSSDAVEITVLAARQ